VYLFFSVQLMDLLISKTEEMPRYFFLEILFCKVCLFYVALMSKRMDVLCESCV